VDILGFERDGVIHEHRRIPNNIATAWRGPACHV
jgi:hypothetical protein